MATLSPPSMLRLRRMFRKELLQLVRDRRLLIMLILAPVLQLLVYGYAVTTEVRNVPTIILDRDATAASRAVADALEASGDFRVTAYATDPREIVRALDRGTAVLAVDIPRGYARALTSGGPVPVQVVIDGTSANTATVAQAYVAEAIESQGARLLARTGSLSRGEPAASLEARIWYNPGLESRVYYVPATTGVIVLNLGLMLTALAVVREREQGTLEQLLVSPITPLEIVIGKTVPVAALVMVDVAIVDIVGVVWFHVPFEGGVALLALSSLTFVLAGLGAGVLLSTVAKTQQEVSMSMFPILLPVMLLSGMIFPISSMPRPIQWLTLLNPLRYQLVVLRAVFLKGAGVGVLWPQLVPMAIMAIGLMLLAAWRFNQRLG